MRNDLHELKVDRQRRLVAAMLAIDPMHPACASAHHFRLCNGNERERREAALALGVLGAAASPALRSLVSATREDDPALVRDAVTALGMLGATARDALPRLRAGLSAVPGVDTRELDPEPAQRAEREPRVADASEVAEAGSGS